MTASSATPPAPARTEAFTPAFEEEAPAGPAIAPTLALTAEAGEERAHPRRACELPVLLCESDNRVRGAIAFDALDLSVGGAFLRSNLLFELGDFLEVQFEIPGGPCVRARGRVARVVRGGSPTDKEASAGMGIAFIEMSESDRDAVRRFVLLGDGPEAS